MRSIDQRRCHWVGAKRERDRNYVGLGWIGKLRTHDRKFQAKCRNQESQHTTVA
jgi:hypothetical protein